MANTMFSLSVICRAAPRVRRLSALLEIFCLKRTKIYCRDGSNILIFRTLYYEIKLSFDKERCGAVCQTLSHLTVNPFIIPGSAYLDLENRYRQQKTGPKGRFNIGFCGWLGSSWIHSQLLFHMMTSSNGNVFRVTGPLWGESIRPCLSKRSRRRRFETPWRPLWRHYCKDKKTDI